MQKTSATLLIIDDDEVVRASLAAYLEDSGFSVLQASNGIQGLQVFEQQSPDLVICDLRMPQMSGLELIRQITERSPQMPVIVISGAGVMSDVVEALRLGAADYLIKPLEDLAVLIALACLVTAVGLTCACAEYFSTVLPLSFFLYGVGVVMLAGSGSIFAQQYDLSLLITLSV